MCHLLETLRDRFLFFEGSTEGYVKMHNVFHDNINYVREQLSRHIFMVNRGVNSKDFPRKISCKQYNHFSIIAKKFDELLKPLFCSRLELLMLKLFADTFKV